MDAISVNIMLPITLETDDPKHLGASMAGPVSVGIQICLDNATNPDRSKAPENREGAILAAALTALYMAIDDLTERAEAKGLTLRRREEAPDSRTFTQAKGDA